MRRDLPALFHGRGIVFISGIGMTLLCASQLGFGAAVLRPWIRGRAGVRQSVAVPPVGRAVNGLPAPSVVVARRIGSLGDLVTLDSRRRAIASFQPLLSCSPAKLRSRDLPRSGVTADRGHAPYRLRRSVHTLLKVSRCAVLTQSRNSGNNLQLSEKSFRRSGIAISRLRSTPGNGAKRRTPSRTITRPHHFKLTPLG